MRNINFKLKNKNDSQMKNEILSKMKQVKKIIQDDMKYESLFYDVVRICEAKKPTHILLENVKGLTTKRHKDTFEKILS